jgi:hypothetical protein
MCLPFNFNSTVNNSTAEIPVAGRLMSKLTANLRTLRASKQLSFRFAPVQNLFCKRPLCHFDKNHRPNPGCPWDLFDVNRADARFSRRLPLEAGQFCLNFTRRPELPSRDELSMLDAMSNASNSPAASTLILSVFILAGDVTGAQQPFGQYGQVSLFPMASAPFPHAKRAEGYTYKDQFFSASDHYRDNSVVIFVPNGLRETGRIDLVIHFHGWRNTIEGVLRQYKLIEQLSRSGRNAILVVPQGPRNAPDSFGGKLEDSNGFKSFVDETVQLLRTNSPLKKKNFVLGNIILSGHSGGYQVISSILDRGGLSKSIKEVWLFDALYGQTDKFLAWATGPGVRFINIYTENGGTKKETERMMSLLQDRGIPFFSGQEEDLNRANFRNNRLIFLFTRLGHNEVIEKHQSFEAFLETSCLEGRDNPGSIKH